MAVKTFKPTTPSRRNMSVPSFDEVTKFTPEKSLIATKKKHAGRNSYGRITVRHQGGGNKLKYRIIDFRRAETAEPATVIGVEYDPNRTAYIALLQHADGKKSYILAPAGVTDGDRIYSGAGSDIKPGNTLPIANIPVGTVINNIEIYPGKGAQLVRSAGNMAQPLSLWLRKTAWLRSDFPPERSASSVSTARQRSVRSATSSMRQSRSVKPARSVIWASVLPSAVRS